MKVNGFSEILANFHTSSKAPKSNVLASKQETIVYYCMPAEQLAHKPIELYFLILWNCPNFYLNDRMQRY